MLLKLCFDAHCLVARWKNCSGSSFANSFNLFRYHLVNCNSKCRVWFFYAGFFSTWCARIERQKQEYGTARPFPITLSWFPCTVFCCGFCQKVLGLEIRCVLSLWKGPRSIQNIVWDFFTGKASGVFVCIFS
ncbi:unnamed protein product [Sphagnum jensenii]|uniref:Uncharacterized protein n=1 Tax=Sphagnum jensenii TaxID=128206 RepID=A0ABP0X9G2_9BRYO